jgi:FkbM family methyltransferase
VLENICQHYSDDLFKKDWCNRRLPKYFLDDLKRLNERHTVIDVGANVGHISEILARTGASVISFEPSSRAYDQLNKISKKYPNIKPFKKAAGTQNREVKLYLNCDTDELPDRDLTQSSSLLVEKPNVSSAIFDTVDEIDFSSYLKSLNTQIELMKVDIEGYEIALVNHLIDTNTICLINNIYVETHECQFPELKEVTEDLKTKVEQLGLNNKFKFDWH